MAPDDEMGSPTCQRDRTNICDRTGSVLDPHIRIHIRALIPIPIPIPTRPDLADESELVGNWLKVITSHMRWAKWLVN